MLFLFRRHHLSIQFVLRSDTTDAAAAKKAVHHEFHFELQSKLTSLDEKPNQAIIAIVGDGMKGTPGVSGKVFQALGTE